ncbi:uncharacterized protein HD556DRAFT_1442478 [Suillus plorans]|uniref:Ricin B lectin domain-containing protein n=1 Tax=Suillus plorans TaxID=116603 RepID=A0A9P7AT22_9AGAM|nr:uncharacterized protein HD556DRAFT_1442478 [Suillus plorans]KAG1795140.1 hypothetical protein HD556DRAFT_1442478 [Suillus plorans]
MALKKHDYSCVVGSPPCDDSVQKWEIAPSGAGYTIRNMQTGTHLSVKGISRGTAIFAGHFPTAWQIIDVKVDDENSELVEIRWPHTEYMFDLADWGSSTPGTKVQLMDIKLNAVQHRCRLWKPIFMQHTLYSGLSERMDDDTSSTSTINAADVPEGGELVLVTTTTTKTVVTKVPKY